LFHKTPLQTPEWQVSLHRLGQSFEEAPGPEKDEEVFSRLFDFISLQKDCELVIVSFNYAPSALAFGSVFLDHFRVALFKQAFKMFVVCFPAECDIPVPSCVWHPDEKQYQVHEECGCPESVAPGLMAGWVSADDKGVDHDVQVNQVGKDKAQEVAIVVQTYAVAREQAVVRTVDYVSLAGPAVVAAVGFQGL